MSLTLNKATEQVVLTLNKQGITDIPKDINVSLVLDISDSMSTAYNSGAVSRVLQRLISILNTIDDDGQLELVLFENKAHHYGTLNVNQYEGTDALVADILNKYAMGGTSFTPAINKILSVLTKESTTSKIKGFFFNTPKKEIEGKQLIVFISDGDCDDSSSFREKVKELEKLPNVYLQCVAIGYDSSFLKGVASQSDSVGYSSVRDFNQSDETLISSILNAEVISKFAKMD